MFASLFTYSISLCGKAKISTWLLGEIFTCLACRPLIYSALIWVKAIYELGNQPYAGWRGGRKSSHPPRVCSFKVGLFFFLRREAYEYVCITDCVVKPVFKKKNIVFVVILIHNWGFSAYLLLLEESAGVAVSWSPIFSRVWRRGCHCFSIEWCCLLTETQYNIFPNYSHCFCVPASEHQVLYLAALIVKIKLQLPRLYAKKGTAKGLLSYFHFVVRTVKRGRGSAVGTVLEQQDLWEAVTQTAYKD